MNKPEEWYGFRVFCKLHESGQSNMSAYERQQYCNRKDRHGKERPRYDHLRCHWNVCPRLKNKTEEEVEALIKNPTDSLANRFL